MSPLPPRGEKSRDGGASTTNVARQGDFSPAHDYASANTPIPGPSPLEGEGRHYVEGHRYSAHAAGAAKRLRLEMTLGEKVLGRELRELDLHVRHQAPIGRYVADFAIHAAKLIVEVDGASHTSLEAEEHDAVRDAFLRSQGFRVLRIADGDVLADPAACAQRIYEIATGKALPLEGGGLGGGVGTSFASWQGDVCPPDRNSPANTPSRGLSPPPPTGEKVAVPQLLLELFSEEIPARMQAGAARDLERTASERLRAQELTWTALRTFAGPRRLTLVIDGLPTATPDREEELKGPKASAPPQALEGFLRKAGVAREFLVERDGVLFAVSRRAGRPTAEIAAEAVGEIVRAFPWPKSMRSGASSFRWVRPLKRVLFLFDGAVVPFEIDGIVAGDLTEGHRFMGPGAPFAVAGFDDYAAKLEAARVVLDPAERRRRIAEGAARVCAAEGLELVPDEGLLDEVSGLAEWPVLVLGAMDAGFLDLPPEVIRTSMRTHQKYFAVRRPGETALAPRFVVVANVEAADGGAEIARGNAKVLSARLADARFFWDEDRKPGAFERWAEKLRGVTFHAKLGTLAERVERIAALAREIAPAVGADPDLAERAAQLAKLDLASAMVGEFPELQGVMGGYYVRLFPFPPRGGRE